MSLQKAANYLKAHGRDGDTELVHMTKGEVKGLQALALAHGGSLSVNPHTGLPEASFLKNILPMIAGAALTPFIGPYGAALAVGGEEALRTGDLGTGVMRGLGALGGANLFTNLAAAAPSAATDVGASTLTEAGQPMFENAAKSNIQSAFNLPQTSTSIPGATAPGSVAGDVLRASAAPTTPTTYSNMMAGAKNLSATPDGVTNFLGSNKMNLAMSAAPAIGEAMSPKVDMPKPEEEDPRYKGSPYNYRLASNFGGYTPATPNPYYRPTGLGYAAGGEVEHYAEGGLRLGDMRANIQKAMERQTQTVVPYSSSGLEYEGYAAGGDIMMAAGGSYDDEPRGDDQGFGYAAGGQLGGYSDGGRMLKGPGDGMSDSIPAVIGKRQPARLADGEFVVPADVVSHLGNGSTDAGAKRLYAMMDKVRTARTGKKKQAKAIKADKYVPA